MLNHRKTHHREITLRTQNVLTCYRWFRLSVTAVTLCLLLSGCSPTAPESSSDGTSDNVPSSAGDSSRPRVALIMKSLANEFFSTMAKGAEAHQTAHSDQYELIVNGIKDETDVSGQVSLVEQMVAQQVNAIVIAPADSKALLPALKNALDSGITVVNIDNKLDTEVLNSMGISIPFVGPNNRTGAKQVADYLVGKLQKGDEVAILEGVQTSFNGQQRKLGFEDALKAGGMQISDSQSARWEMSIANQTAAGMLTAHPDLKAILACNDSMALGALAAVKAADRLNTVQIIGFDNISAVQQAIRDGEILATADQHSAELAVFGIEAALETITEGTIPADRETPVDLVTAETLKGP